jgi:hypothetical protein
MNLYEIQIEKELNHWHKEITKRGSLFTRMSQGVQEKMRGVVPKKVQNTITVAFEKFVKTFMAGTEIFGFTEKTDDLTLSERDYLVIKSFEGYSRTAVLEGAATGAGGFIVGLADLPALLGIKIAFLAKAAKLYGYDPDEPSERLFLLYIFQLAFSGSTHQQECFDTLSNWDKSSLREINWEKLQVEYRDYLDLSKMLQMLPVIGAPVGALANQKLMKRLLEFTMNAYRMRILGKHWHTPLLPE